MADFNSDSFIKIPASRVIRLCDNALRNIKEEREELWAERAVDDYRIAMNSYTFCRWLGCFWLKKPVPRDLEETKAYWKRQADLQGYRNYAKQIGMFPNTRFEGQELLVKKLKAAANEKLKSEDYNTDMFLSIEHFDWINYRDPPKPNDV